MDLDAWDWLDAEGAIPSDPPARRRRALLVARCVEYGGPLAPGGSVATLIPCSRRPGGSRCDGLLRVEKPGDGPLVALCPGCGAEVLRVRGWETTPWARGPIAAEPEPAAPGQEALDRRLASALARMGSSLDPGAIKRHVAVARTPSRVIEIVAGTGAVPDEATFEVLCDALVDAWNHTPRPELGGRTPAQTSRAMAMPADAARLGGPGMEAVQPEAPCLCGSGAPAGQCCAPRFH